MRARPTPFLIMAVLIGVCTPTAPAKGFAWRDYQNKPDEWFRGAEGRTILGNIFSHQSPAGSWPKNLDTSKAPIGAIPPGSRGRSTTGRPSTSCGS